MTPEKIQKLMEKSAAGHMTPQRFAQVVMEQDGNLTAADATLLMKQYQRNFPQACAAMAAPKPALKKRSKPVKTVAQAAAVLTQQEVAEVMFKGIPALVNRSAVKKYALEMSVKLRAGKFERVSKDFIDGVESTLDAIIRDIGKGYRAGADLDPGHAPKNFVTGRAVKQAREWLDEAVVAVIRHRVHRHPTVGITLK